LIHFNSRSLQSNFEAIQDYLNQFKSKFNIIAISETWLKDDKIHEFDINGYEMFYTNRINKKGGGVALYIDKNIHCSIVDNMCLVVDDLFECVTVELVLPKNKNIIVSCIYRRPGPDFTMFMEWIEKIFTNNNKK